MFNCDNGPFNWDRTITRNLDQVNLVGNERLHQHLIFLPLNPTFTTHLLLTQCLFYFSSSYRSMKKYQELFSKNINFKYYFEKYISTCFTWSDPPIWILQLAIPQVQCQQSTNPSLLFNILFFAGEIKRLNTAVTFCLAKLWKSLLKESLKEQNVPCSVTSCFIIVQR